MASNHRIYTSPLPPVNFRNQSIFTYLFSTDNAGLIGGFPASRPAFIDAATGATLTRSDLKNHALSFGYGLRSVLGAKRGDTMLVYSPNSLHWPVMIFGAIAAGMRCTLANSAYNARELAYQYTDSRAYLIFTSEEGLPVARQALKDIGLSELEADKRIIVLTSNLTWAGGPDMASVVPGAAGLVKFEDLLGKGSLESEEKFDGDDVHETVYLCYSSGTTGKPKGVETSHRNVIFVLEASKATFPPSLPEDTMVAVLPFYHIYGAVKIVQFPLTRGLPAVIMSRFDPAQFCGVLEKYKITVAFIVPPILLALARHPVVDKHDVSALRLLYCAAAPLGRDLQKEVFDRLLTKRKSNPAPLQILQGYGLTETSPTTHLQPTGSGHKIGSVGVLLPNLEARLVIDGEGDSAIDAPEGERGELWMRGPGIMKGYLNNPQATKEAITPDGWFKTGDIATRDADGYYYIVDRRKELIKYKGFQVPPAELESVLLNHPEVADAAVIGVYSNKEATELPRAYIVPARPNQVKTEAQKQDFAQQIKEWTHERVARHKYLRGGVVLIDAVPKSAAGKIIRRELRDRAKQELAGKDPRDNEPKAKL